MNAQERAQDPVEDFHVISQISVQQMESPMAVPLPLDIPPVPNLSSLPAHVLHSGTVETLIGQNEDLMARLKVNIRRNSVLEQQIMEQDRLLARLRNDHASLIAQHQVLMEKNELLSDKTRTFDSSLEELREAAEISQIRAESAEERSAELRAGLAFEKTFRRRVGAWVRPYIDRLQEHLVEARGRIAFLDRQLGTREAVIGDLRERLDASERLAQETVYKAKTDNALLVESCEAALRETSLLRDKASFLEDAVSARATAENRIISLERKNSDIERAWKEELALIQDQLAQFRWEAKELAAASLAARAERDLSVAQATDARTELARAQDQFESLQAVWAEAQKKFEASQLQQESLNKLNQELSRQLKVERKAREAAGASVASARVQPSGGASASDTAPTNARLERIDALLAELESGYTKASGLDFTESPSPETQM